MFDTRSFIYNLIHSALYLVVGTINRRCVAAVLLCCCAEYSGSGHALNPLNDLESVVDPTLKGLSCALSRVCVSQSVSNNDVVCHGRVRRQFPQCAAVRLKTHRPCSSQSTA